MKKIAYCFLVVLAVPAMIASSASCVSSSCNDSIRSHPNIVECKGEEVLRISWVNTKRDSTAPAAARFSLRDTGHWTIWVPTEDYSRTGAITPEAAHEMREEVREALGKWRDSSSPPSSGGWSVRTTMQNEVDEIFILDLDESASDPADFRSGANALKRIANRYLADAARVIVAPHGSFSVSRE